MRTEDRALVSAWPRPVRTVCTAGVEAGSFQAVIDQMLLVHRDAPRKQGHTATRIFQWLLDEHGVTNVSYEVVRGYVAKRPELRIETGRGSAQVFVPQPHLPGTEAEVDFGEVVVDLRGSQ
ncbi:hypothetical protein ACQPXM_11400 [Kribbella sp. CA-253562]|uniref:hypothetical protein n=1 Tax=Kribbella sp. CA-253562 TaxID=3239942 RepID=UPI003D8D2845